MSGGRDFEGGWSSTYQAGSRDSSADFNRLSHLISSNVQKISQNVSSIQRLVNQIATQQDSEQLRGKLHEVQHYTNTLAKDTSKHLRDLSSLPVPENASDKRQRQLQRERLMNDFSVVLNNFQSAQRSAAQKEKASVLRARANSGLGGNPFEDNAQDLMSNQAPKSETALQIEKDVDIQALREREQAIRQLESDIVDVNQIFKDLALMVHEQGETIDSIEANVESAQIHVNSAHSDIQKAHQHKRSLRKKKLICFIILIVLLIIIAVIIYVSVKK